MLIGLVGKPSVGKSTFFKSVTLADVEIASYPFTTIKPNSGVGYVKIECIDKEFNTKCNPRHGFCLEDSEKNKNFRFVPVEIMDVAGLVPGASEGKGLGNQFLDDLGKADAFIILVDTSGKTNAEGKIVESGSYDPCYDIEFLEEELNKWYYNILQKVWKSFTRKIEMSKSDLNFADAVANQFSGLKMTSDDVKDVLRDTNFKEKPSFWSEEQLKTFASLLRRKSKPMIIAANKIDLLSAEENYEKLKKKFPDLEIIPCSADSELALREASKLGLIDYIPGNKNFKILNPEKLDEKQKNALEKIKENILDKYEYGTGIQEILNRAVLSLLDYIAIFPASANRLTDSKGNVLPDCFLMKNGSTALDFAYKIHEDFGKNFVKAINARTKKILGKDYILKNRDALEIMKK